MLIGGDRSKKHIKLAEQSDDPSRSLKDIH